MEKANFKLGVAGDAEPFGFIGLFSSPGWQVRQVGYHAWLEDPVLLPDSEAMLVIPDPDVPGAERLAEKVAKAEFPLILAVENNNAGIMNGLLPPGGWVGLVDIGAAPSVLAFAIRQCWLAWEQYCLTSRLNRTIGQYQNVASHIQTGLFRFRYDLEYHFFIDYISPRCSELTGVNIHRLEQELGAFMELIFPEDLETYLKKTTEAFKKLVPLEIMVRMLVKGQKRIMQLRFVPQTSGVPDQSGFHYCDGTIEDVTEQQDQVERKNQLISSVGKLKKYLDEFKDLLDYPLNATELTESWMSRREEGVYLLLKAGLSNAEIAARLGISVSTVKKHVVAVFRKHGVSRRTELMLRGDH